MKSILVFAGVTFTIGSVALAQESRMIGGIRDTPLANIPEKIRVIAFGAHPDDADIKVGGVAAKFAARGHLVKFVSLTSGDAGHCEQGGGALAKRSPRW